MGRFFVSFGGWRLNHNFAVSFLITTKLFFMNTNKQELVIVQIGVTAKDLPNNLLSASRILPWSVNC